MALESPAKALGVLGRLQHRHGLQLCRAELGSFAAPLVRRSLRWGCPSDEEAAEELVRQRQGRPVAAEGSPLPGSLKAFKEGW